MIDRNLPYRFLHGQPLNYLSGDNDNNNNDDDDDAADNNDYEDVDDNG